MEKESPDETLYSSSLDTEAIPVADETDPNSPKKPEAPKKKKRFKKPARSTIILLAGLIILLGSTLAVIILLLKNREQPTTNVVINTQSLDNGTLNQLTAQAGGTINQQLTISPNTIFKGSIEVQKSALVREDLSVGGKTLLQGPVVTQDSLEVNRSLTVRGATTIGNNLTVGGQITAASLSVGTLTISSINLSNNLTFAGHLIPNGKAPSVRTSVAAGGGSVVISGNDTAGTITINIGNNVTTPGEMAIITFATSYNTTPKVQLTPINAASSALGYYVTRNAQFFTVDTSSLPTAGASYVFDYFVTQ